MTRAEEVPPRHVYLLLIGCDDSVYLLLVGCDESGHPTRDGDPSYTGLCPRFPPRTCHATCRDNPHSFESQPTSSFESQGTSQPSIPFSTAARERLPLPA